MPDDLTPERIAALLRIIEALRVDLAEERADAVHWLMVADGINHDPRCVNGVSPVEGRGECMRCERERLGGELFESQTDVAVVSAERDRLREFARWISRWQPETHPGWNDEYLPAREIQERADALTRLKP